MAADAVPAADRIMQTPIDAIEKLMAEQEADEGPAKKGACWVFIMKGLHQRVPMRRASFRLL